MKIAAFALVAVVLAAEIGLRVLVGPPVVFLYADGQRDVCDTSGRSRKIDVIGDSFTYGKGVRWDETFVGLLSCRHAHISFRNLGINSAGMAQYRAVAKDMVRPDVTDVVVVLYGDDLMLPPETGWTAIKRFLARLSAVAAMLRTWKQRLGGSQSNGNGAASPPGAHPDLAQSRLAELVGLLRNRAPGVRLWFAGGPTKARQDSDVTAALVEESASHLGFTAIETASYFDANYYLPGDVHWNAAGHSVMAQILGHALKL